MPNEKNLTPELLEKVKSATSAATLLALARENGVGLTAVEAALYFSQLHPKVGALSDEELDNVSGGCNSKPDYCKNCGWSEFTQKDLKVAGNYAIIWICKKCGEIY